MLFHVKHQIIFSSAHVNLKRVTKIKISPGTPIHRRNSGKFNNLNFKPKVAIFEINHKSDNKGEFLDFNECTLYMNCTIFMKIAFLIMAIFVEKSQKSQNGFFFGKIAKFISRVDSLKSRN